MARVDALPNRISEVELRAADAAYREAMAIVVPRLAAALGTELPGVVERAVVVDRATWVRANVSTFRALITRIEGQLLEQVIRPGGGLSS